MTELVRTARGTTHCDIHATYTRDSYNEERYKESIGQRSLCNISTEQEKLDRRLSYSHTLYEWFSLPHPSGPNKTVLLLHKLLLKTLPVTTLYP